MTEERYDVVILGGGPGGYRAAERLGAKGKRVVLVEKAHLGGVCLNEGCIPTKTLLHSAKVLAHGKEAEQFGVSFGEASYDLPKAMAWKTQVVESLRKGVAYQMKRFNVDVVSGAGHLVTPKTVAVGETSYTGDAVIIATGSSPVILPIPGAEGPKVLTSTEVLELETLPKSMVVIGGGVIGMEFASLFSTLGVEVHVVEMLDEIVPVLDAEVSAAMRKALRSINYHLGTRVAEIDGGTVRFTSGESTEEIAADLVLMSVGRRPNTNDLGFAEAGIDMDRSAIRVDERMQTNLPGVFAVGDVTGLSQLAHSAYRMGDVAARSILGDSDRMRYEAIPSVVYTIPEAAGCGLTEQQARDAGYDLRTATLPMRANGRFLAEYGRGAPGFCKVLADVASDRLLGVHMFGDGCSEMIFGAAAMIEAELRVKDVREIVFPHPTVSEVIVDALWELE